MEAFSTSSAFPGTGSVSPFKNPGPRDFNAIKIALAPLFIMWFGIGMMPKI